MPPDLASPNGTTKPKQRRISRACDYCHQRSIRCRPSGDGTNCQNCKSFAQECTYHRKPRRRGAPPRAASAGGSAATAPPALVKDRDSLSLGGGGGNGGGSGNQNYISSPDGPQLPLVPYRVSMSSSHSQTHSQSNSHSHSHSFSQAERWTAPHIASQATVMDLVELYFEIVYPIFPLFHQPSFIRTISRADYLNNRSLFTTTMAVCALVSGRVRDGSVTNPRWDTEHLKETSPDVFYAEARRQLVDITAVADFNTARAHAVLAITAIQNGKIRDMHQHLGTYHTLVAMDSLHDESNWPTDISIIEREERRRLFWSIYTLDIYTAVVWGGILRSREQQSNVAYPAEMDDEFIDNNTSSLNLAPNGMSGTSTRRALTVGTESWLSGWNFITDLYRVLEHALARFRGHRNRIRRGTFLREIFEDQSTVTETSVCNSVLQMYINLPHCFKETPQITYNVKKDRFGFQAANITASVQLVRMVLFAAGGASIEERCEVAREVVDAFAAIPVEYLVAISAPLLHHLGGIGAVLGSVFEEPLSESDYNRVRSIMLSMAQLLETLETIHQRSSASEKLRSQVARIDEYMVSQRQAATMPVHTVVHQHQQEQTQQAQQQALYGQTAGADISGSWMFQVPADLWGGFAWNFDSGQTWS